MRLDTQARRLSGQLLRTNPVISQLRHFTWLSDRGPAGAHPPLSRLSSILSWVGSPQPRLTKQWHSGVRQGQIEAWRETCMLARIVMEGCQGSQRRETGGRWSWVRRSEPTLQPIQASDGPSWVPAPHWTTQQRPAPRIGTLASRLLLPNPGAPHFHSQLSRPRLQAKAGISHCCQDRSDRGQTGLDFRAAHRPSLCFVNSLLTDPLVLAQPRRVGCRKCVLSAVG